MAAVTMSIGLEMDLIWDAVDTLMMIHEALTRRHGERFRQLERAIETCADRDWTVGWDELEPGRFVAGVPRELADLIAQAVELGVIGKGA